MSDAKVKIIEEICLGCGQEKQKMTVVIEGNGEMMWGQHQVLKCDKGHFEVKSSDGQLISYDPKTEYSKFYQ